MKNQKIIVLVEGGLVRGCYTDHSDLDIEVLDLDSDDLNAYRKAEKQCNRLDEEVKNGTLNFIGV